MTIWAIADLHLALNNPEKDMAFFGPAWEDYVQRCERLWRATVQADDLVLIAGDISWAMKAEEAIPDLEWIDRLPGTKVLIKGNHDYWWSSIGRVKKIAPPSLHFLQHTRFDWDSVTISGTRLWDTEEFNFSGYIEVVENPRQKKKGPVSQPELDQKVFERELHRLELALQALNPDATTKIILTHYPPISADLQSSRASRLLEQYEVDYCIFGHLHSLRPNVKMFGSRLGVNYLLTSADYLNFQPLRIL